jgi:hypothetical protein
VIAHGSDIEDGAIVLLVASFLVGLLGILGLLACIVYGLARKPLPPRLWKATVACLVIVAVEAAVIFGTD